MNELNKVKSLKPFTKFLMTIGEIPTSYLVSMTYEEQLLWFCNYLEKTVIPTINNNAESVEELQSLYIQLKSYVDNYFNNLDVQEEINNKLDEMVESGVLPQIISDYLNSKALFCYDNVESMKNNSNFIDGSYAKTLGFYNKNDKGGAIYKIRTKLTSENVNEMDLIQIINTSLVAELIIGTEININQLGAKGDNSFDNSDIIQYAVDNYYNRIINIPNGDYVIDSPINISFSNTTLKGSGYQKTIIRKNSETVNQIQRIYDNEVYNFNERPTGFNIVFPNNSEISNINISDLTISLSQLNNNRNKIGINAPRVIFSNFKNIRINNGHTGIILGGWINKVSQIDNLNCYPYSIKTPSYGLIATTIEKCHSTIGTNSFNDCTNIVLNECSADDGDPCYLFLNCKSATLNSCSTESNSQPLVNTNSYVVINSGDYEGHSVQNLSIFKGFFTVQTTGKLELNNPYIHFEDYSSYGNPTNKNIFQVNQGTVEGNCKIQTPYTNKNYITGNNSYINVNDNVESLNTMKLNKKQITITGETKTEILRIPFEYGKRVQLFIKGYGQVQYYSIAYEGIITGVHYESPIDIDSNVNVVSSHLGGALNVTITGEFDSTNNQLVIYYNSDRNVNIPLYNTIEYNYNY